MTEKKLPPVYEGPSADVDVILIGAGIMSATLGTLLRELEPSWTQMLFERLDIPSQESSGPWNNAGTGHSALCELNYTPMTSDGTVDPTKAIGINERFQVSRQFWTYAVDNGILGDPSEWINAVPHVSFAHGPEGRDYLRKRHEALASSPLFPNMEYTESEDRFSELLPLMAQGRDFSDPVALNYTKEGTDVNFGALAEQLLAHLEQSGTVLRYGYMVKDLTKESDGRWRVTVRNMHTREERTVRSRFVFVGAGGAALKLLQNSGISEIKGFAGFPVSGEFLRCNNPDVIKQHHAKVYGRAAVGAPPMSVPHLDTRVINGRRGLLFGPYAGWTPKFLKAGSFLDLPGSIRLDNLPCFVGVGLTEIPLTKYLITELLKNAEARLESLQEFAPTARLEDWELITAGQRVQVIRRDKKRGGRLEFGTAVVNSADGTIAGLLGASPGASTAVDAMIDVLRRSFGSHFATWEPKLKNMIPSLGRKLNDDPALFREVWDSSQKVLKLEG